MQETRQNPAVENFRLVLADVMPMMANGRGSLSALETVISERLVSCERLLRWAVVQVSGNTCTIEGAYLKASQ